MWELVSSQTECVPKQKNPGVLAVQPLYLCTPEVRHCRRNQKQVDVIQTSFCYLASFIFIVEYYFLSREDVR